MGWDGADAGEEVGSGSVLFRIKLGITNTFTLIRFFHLSRGVLNANQLVLLETRE